MEGNDLDGGEVAGYEYNLVSNPTAKHFEPLLPGDGGEDCRRQPAGRDERERASQNGIDTFFSYDAAQRLTGIEHRNGASLLATLAYTLDGVGNRKSKTLAGLTATPAVESYGYDAVDQLIQAKYGTTRTVGYAYDATGNRRSVSNNGTIQSYTANALNQYTSAAGSTPTYDANGNLASASGATYTYDAQNRLVSATVNGTTTTMSYDARNRVVRRTGGGADLFFTYADWNLLEERNAAGAIQQAYVHGAQIDELLVKITPAGAVYYQADALGSVIALTNETGQLAESYTYDAFGAAAIRDGSGLRLPVSGFANRFLFTGREWIGATRIYDYRNRVYSPVLGRFLQTDPIRFEAEDVNLYRYASNNPVNLWDPYGLCDRDEYQRQADARWRRSQDLMKEFNWSYTTMPTNVTDALDREFPLAAVNAPTDFAEKLEWAFTKVFDLGVGWMCGSPIVGVILGITL